MPRLTNQETITSGIANGTDAEYYLERYSSALPPPVITVLNPSYLVPAPFFPKRNLNDPFPPPKIYGLKLSYIQTPLYLPQSQQLQNALSRPKLVADHYEMAKQNLEIFEDLIKQLVWPMNNKKSAAENSGTSFSPIHPQAGPHDSHQLFKWMKELANATNPTDGFRHAERVKIANGVFNARVSAHHTKLGELLKQANIFASAFVHFAGPDMVDCPSVLQHATEYMDEADPKITLIPANMLP